MFDKATRKKLRIETTKGLLSVEDLWDLPLTSETGKVNLDGIAVALFQQLQSNPNVSFVNKAQKSNELLQLRFDIVRHIIDTRVKESEDASAAKAQADKRQQILEIIAEKEHDSIKSLSLDELKKLI